MAFSHDGQSSTSLLPTTETFPYSELEWAVLLTVLYADLFDYALTEEELYRRLIRHRGERGAVRQAVASLTGRHLAVRAGHITWTGREHLAGVRRHRSAQGEHLWPAARRYAAWLARVPFVRMVAVSGSLAFDNAEATSDIDLFCITEARRLWVARLCIVPLSKLTRFFPKVFPLYLCPNYILARDALTLDDRTLPAAHEVVQAVPLWGRAAYDAFIQANTWVEGFLPQRSTQPRDHRLAEPRRPALTRWCERMLGGSLGDRLDAWAHQAFTAFYRRRAERSGWPWARLAPAYQRNRYTVPEGGYVPVLRRLFAARVHEYLDVAMPATELDRLFTRPAFDPHQSCYDWAGLFEAEYGVSVMRDA